MRLNLCTLSRARAQVEGSRNYGENTCLLILLGCCLLMGGTKSHTTLACSLLLRADELGEHSVAL